MQSSTVTILYSLVSEKNKNVALFFILIFLDTFIYIYNSNNQHIGYIIGHNENYYPVTNLRGSIYCRKNLDVKAIIHTRPICFRYNWWSSSAHFYNHPLSLLLQWVQCVINMES